MANLNHLFDKDAKKQDSSSTENQKTAPKAKPTDETKEVAGTTVETLSQEGQQSEVQAQADAPDETDPYATWTKEDLANERKKAMDEAAKARIEKKELEKQLTEGFEKKLKELADKYDPYMNEVIENRKKQEIEKDAQRSLQEKLTHREIELEKTRLERQQLEDNSREAVMRLQSELDRKVAEIQAYESHYKTQLDKELDEVPVKHKGLAELIVKGAGENAQKALEAIRQAKADNIFGTKKVEVFNGTPNAKQGARFDAASAQKMTREQMTKNQKISEGIKSWKDKIQSKNMRKN